MSGALSSYSMSGALSSDRLAGAFSEESLDELDQGGHQEEEEEPIRGSEPLSAPSLDEPTSVPSLDGAASEDGISEGPLAVEPLGESASDMASESMAPCVSSTD